MKRIFSYLKRISAWSRVAVTLVAAVTLLLTTSCSATSASATDSPLSPDTVGATKGGMNRYEDTDPRRDLSGVDAKSDRLVESAKASVDKVQDVDDFVDNYQSGTPLGQRVSNIGDNVSDKVENLADDVTSANVPRDRIRDLGTQNAENILDDTAKSAKRAARDAKTSARRAGRDAADAAGNAKRSTQRAVKDTADAVSDTASDAAKSAKRGAEDAIDKISR